MDNSNEPELFLCKYSPISTFKDVFGNILALGYLNILYQMKPKYFIAIYT